MPLYHDHEGKLLGRYEDQSLFQRDHPDVIDYTTAFADPEEARRHRRQVAGDPLTNLGHLTDLTSMLLTAFLGLADLWRSRHPQDGPLIDDLEERAQISRLRAKLEAKTMQLAYPAKAVQADARGEDWTDDMSEATNRFTNTYT